MRLPEIIFVLAAVVFAQTSDVPYAPQSDGPGPTFTIESSDVAYPGAFASISMVDFHNLRVPILDEAGKLTGTFVFKKGHYEQKEPYNYYSIDLDAVHYLGGPDQSAALAIYSWFAVGGSSSQGGTAELFKVTEGRLRLIQRIEWDRHFDPGQPYYFFDVATNTLLIRSAHYIPGDAHCCVSAMDAVSMQWNGTRFVETAIHTELSAYGKREGKTLPRSSPK